MKDKDLFVITINREFGSGGHEIGTQLAQRLQVKLIDKQLLKAVAEKFQMTEGEAEQLEARRPSWWEDFSLFYQKFVSRNEYTVNPRDITSRQLFFAQAQAMRNIARKGSCVVVGRCGFDVFKSDQRVLKIFIHAPLAVRVNRIMTRYQVDETEARQRISDNDYTRQLYTKTFTGHEWYDVRNYDLSLDVSTFGIEGTVRFLMAYIGKTGLLGPIA